MASNQWRKEEENMLEQSLAFYTEQVPDRWERIGLVLNKTVEEVKKHYDKPVAGLNSIEPISLVSKQGVNTRKRRRNSWSEDEHRLFLIGLKKCGKGDWRGISRNVVITKTPTQVASHAQKYFERQKSEKKRWSIHDITIENTSLATLASNMASTGQQETPTPIPISILIPTPLQLQQPLKCHFCKSPKYIDDMSYKSTKT